jgi:hypothetical protein
MGSAAEARARTGGLDIRRIVYDEPTIARRVAEMGAAIAEAYPDGEDILVLGLLKGSFIFMADLVRDIPRPVTVDFLVASSYGSGTVSSGDVKLLYDPEAAPARASAAHTRVVHAAAQAHCAQPRARCSLGRLRCAVRVPDRLRSGSQRELSQPAVHRESLSERRYR